MLHVYYNHCHPWTSEGISFGFEPKDNGLWKPFSPQGHYKSKFQSFLTWYFCFISQICLINSQELKIDKDSSTFLELHLLSGIKSPVNVFWAYLVRPASFVSDVRREHGNRHSHPFLKVLGTCISYCFFTHLCKDSPETGTVTSIVWWRCSLGKLYLLFLTTPEGVELDPK